MITVYKYSLEPGDNVTVLMPEGAEILHVATQGDVPCIWARVDTERPKKPYIFHMRGTGHPNATGDHVGSFLMHNGSLVFHLFCVSPMVVRLGV